MPAKKKPIHAAAKELTHIDAKGAARMVDVSAKPPTDRRATARGKLLLSRDTIALVRDGRAPKGDVLASARLAGIMAAKRTSELIPLAHPLPITHASVDLAIEAKGIAIEATVATTAQTGVEMEAMTAASVAALTIYDMVKAVDKSMVIGDIRLMKKTGGKSGEYRRRGES